MSVKLVLMVRLSLTVSKYLCTKVDRTGLKKHSLSEFARVLKTNP